MLYEFLFPFAENFQFFNVFKYITFRTGGAILTALIISFILGPFLIKTLRNFQKEGQPIRMDGPSDHIIKKKGTPTMGGILILFASLGSSILWMKLDNQFVWTVLLIMVGFGSVGIIDDWIKLSKNSSSGLNGKIKLSLQILIAIPAIMSIIETSPPDILSGLAIPFLKDTFINLGYFFIPFSIFVVVGSSNSVNLTDGLDGLAIVPVMIAASCFALIAYLVGNINFSSYLQLNYVPGVGEIAIVLGALFGAGLGFLWFNAPPAEIFMGDTGSLSLGGVIGISSVATRHELVLVIIGGLFVVETISVILQVGYFKLTGKRIFLMAPLHHHFEKRGWEESTIVIRFWIIAVILALIGLSTLKLR